MDLISIEHKTHEKKSKPTELVSLVSYLEEKPTCQSWICSMLLFSHLMIFFSFLLLCPRLPSDFFIIAIIMKF